MSRTPTPTATTPVDNPAGSVGAASNGAYTSHRRPPMGHQTFSAPYYPAPYVPSYPQQQQQHPQQQQQHSGYYSEEQESRKRPASSAPEQDDDDRSPSAGASATTTPREEAKNKRTKTQRACDPCRRKKIRLVSSPIVCGRCLSCL